MEHNTLDLARIALATARLSHFITDDKLSHWHIHQPLADKITHAFDEAPEKGEQWWMKYHEGLSCTWCMSIWAGSLVVISYYLSRKSPVLRTLWAIGSDILASSYVASMIEANSNKGLADGPHADISGTGEIQP